MLRISRISILLVLLFPVVIHAQNGEHETQSRDAPPISPAHDTEAPPIVPRDTAFGTGSGEEGARTPGRREDDPCGFSLRKPGDILLWGYGHDALIVDMQSWILHTMTSIDVIGNSVQGRPLYHMVFTNPASRIQKKRIWIHARTHPIESESSQVARAMINELLSGSELGNLLLDHAIVHVLPMLNPDGVELRYPRTNFNGVDLESNWGTALPEPEVLALREHLNMLMKSDTPIDIALNLHSAYDCKRFFIYHAAEGSSVLFTQLQQRFIGFVRDRFPGGIEPYDYFVSWTTGTPDRYPESWFWRNYREEVMALTYEDMNCAAAGDFERSARALLGGVADYLGFTGVLSTASLATPVEESLFAAVFPNPVSRDGRLTVRLRADLTARPLRISLHDRLGREVALLYEGVAAGGHTFVQPVSNLATGNYYLRAVTDRTTQTRPVLLLH
ncbi:MAG: hypothetical protein KFH87_03670 [Bacteroidetes bacterium]|nr:hypothetical protein [Bacteroidota bacterium]